MEDPLEDSEILHSDEGGDVERWLEPRNKTFVFVFACVSLSIAFYILYLCGCSSYLIPLLVYHTSLSLSVNTHLNKEAIEHPSLYLEESKRRSSKARHKKFSFNSCFE